MVLRVAAEDFPEAVRRYAQTDEVFVSESGGTVNISAVDPETGVIVSAFSELKLSAVQEMLGAAGMKVKEGEWSRQPESALTEYYVAAVSYKSKDPSPGLWISAYPRQPTVMDVLRSVYDEFVETGEASKASFEQFLSSAKPNVLILSPDELRAFATE